MSIAQPGTELVEDRFAGLDNWAPERILAALLDGQETALRSVSPAIPAIARAAERAAKALRDGGRLCYLGCGSPALIAMGDALEIPQTYGIARDRIVLLFAGGDKITQNLTGDLEDNADLARRDVRAAGVGPADCLIAISASGTTPYTVAGLIAAHEAGAATIGVAGNPGAPLLRAADVPVLLDAGPEVIAGSTRMGAGTAQKAMLNMFSTLIGVHLGHVHDGLMVNLRADNDKLRGRAARMVMQIAGVDETSARRALHLAEDEVKPAVLLASGVTTVAEAQRILEQSKGNLRQALSRVGAGVQA